MKKVAPEPFKPCVNITQIVYFDPERPETYTPSPIINAVLRAVAAVGLNSAKAIADHLQVPSRQLWGAVQLLTGMDEYTFRVNVALNRLYSLKAEHPDWGTDQFAHALGYSCRTSLYRLLGREEYNQDISNKTRPNRYAVSRKKGGDKD